MASSSAARTWISEPNLPTVPSSTSTKCEWLGSSDVCAGAGAGGALLSLSLSPSSPPLPCAPYADAESAPAAWRASLRRWAASRSSSAYLSTRPLCAAPICSCPATTPHVAMPMHGRLWSASLSVRPTIDMTPAFVPPVITHALVILAALLRPRRKTSCCFSVIVANMSRSAAPVTEMSTAGGRSFHVSRKSSPSCSIVFSSVLSETQTHLAGGRLLPAKRSAP